MPSLTPDFESQEFQDLLVQAGFEDLKKAAKNFRLLAGEERHHSLFKAVLPHLLQSLKSSPDPDMALNGLERYAEAVINRGFLFSLFRDSRRVLDLLVAVFAHSEYLTDILVRHPQFFEWLLEPGILRRPRSQEELYQELSAMVDTLPTLDKKMAALRRFKKREVLRIGLQDVLGNLDLAAVTEELSKLADVELEKAFEFSEAELKRRYGTPQYIDPEGRLRECRFCIIGMGKLGGEELNFSSDIDLIYLYTAEGETTGVKGPDGGLTGVINNHQYYAKLAEMIGRAIGEQTAEGHVFRVDLRLRPEGRSGDLASSLRSFELYYESWGQTWERQALIKARPVAGDPRLGKAFLKICAPFIYRKYLDFSAIAEVRAMKDRINLGMAMDGKAHRHVKLGYGGIREVEFVVQAFQLIHGGQNTWIREANTLRALHRLVEQKYLSYEDYSALFQAYVFLRRVEHRLQLEHQIQTHVLPEDVRELARLAKRLGYRSPDPASEFLDDYRRHTRAVRRIYDGLFYEREEEVPAHVPLTLFFQALGDEEGVRERLKEVGFGDEERAFRNLFSLRDGPPFAHYGPESRKYLAHLAPQLLEALKGAPDPDQALTAFERFVSAIGARTTFLGVLADNKALLNLLIRLFGSSEFLTGILTRHPELLEVLLDPEVIHRPRPRAKIVEELRQGLRAASSPLEKLDALRRFKKAEELRIGMRDILGEVDLLETMATLSTVADLCLEAALEMAQAELKARFGVPQISGDGQCPVIIVGLGKLGGQELNYASDLDLAFVYGGEGGTSGDPGSGISNTEYFSHLADRVIKALTTITAEGFAYRVDTRLRPGGQKGPLAQPLEAYRRHFERLAETWERQAYIKARVVAGDAALGEDFSRLVEGFVYQGGPEGELISKIHAMRRRMLQELGMEGGELHVKLGPGGIVDIEFIVQLLQLQKGATCQGVRRTGTLEALEALEAYGYLDAEDCRTLQGSYLFLRRVENRLRIVADLSVDTLPKAPRKMDQLARRLGYLEEGETSPSGRFLADYQAHTRQVQEIYKRVFGL
ncbi:MAG: glutamate-ammonia-ligase adenylyltransferase [candidate division NC10 bacterium]|nr:glutamate-ammonia-ligase adenylyltransferase [candidate division NC10 bacterium]